MTRLGPESTDGFFDEPIAAICDRTSASMSTPAAVDPVVDFPVERANGGRALERWAGLTGEPHTSDTRTLVGVLGKQEA